MLAAKGVSPGMWKEHPNFEPPAQDTVIWRYFDFTKFVDLLETSTLYFTRADKFADRFEGSYPRFNVENRKTLYGPDIPQQLFEQMSKAAEAWRRFVAVNCWHMNSHESAAMWKLYLKSNEGIAIKSTYKSLVECFSGYDNDVFIGKVKYIDYNREWMAEGNVFYPFLHKRKSFEHENELRALVWRWPFDDDQKLNLSIDVIDQGITVPINLPCLVHQVFVAPDAPIWFRRLVSDVSKRYGLQIRIEQSVLSEAPVY